GKGEGGERSGGDRQGGVDVYADGDGMVVIRGRLEPEVGAVVMQALTAAREALYQRRKGDVPAGTSVVDDCRRRRPWSSSRLMRSLSSRKPLFIVAWSPAHRVNAIRSSFTSMPMCWSMPMHRASRCSKAARAFPQERPSVWRAMPA